jgi:hypothetical protein
VKGFIGQKYRIGIVEYDLEMTQKSVHFGHLDRQVESSNQFLYLRHEVDVSRLVESHKSILNNLYPILLLAGKNLELKNQVESPPMKQKVITVQIVPTEQKVMRAWSFFWHTP